MSINLTTEEKEHLIKALCEKLKWSIGYVGYTRAEKIEVAQRLVEICRSLPEDSDGA